MGKLSLFFLAILFSSAAKSQVKTPTLYVAGNVLSEEKMLVSVAGTKTIEGNVVSAELNGKKIEAKTDAKGHALLDFSAIAANVAVPTMVVINSFDKDGKLISTANTTVYKGKPNLVPPVIEQLPKNLCKGEVITIAGQNLGSGSKLIVGEEAQETLSGSDEEMTVITAANPGEQNVYVTTANGTSESQKVNIYSLDFDLAKNSIRPRENVQAQVRYESIPEGTKLIFTNKSPETINMAIPGGQTTGNESIYTVSQKNGTFPVNITGIIRGNFVIALDFDFKNESAMNELRSSLSKMTQYDQKVLFGFLPAETKCALWKGHLSESMKMPLQPKQKELLQELDSYLRPEIFGTTTASSEFKTFALAWYTRARSAFTAGEEIKLTNIVMNLGGNRPTTPLAGEQPVIDCDCVRNGAVGNCPLYHDCKTRNCRDNWCGIFWIWTCDAKCV